MTFHIGQQSGGIINNVQGDQRITGGQRGHLATTEHARQALSDLHQALQASDLAGDTAVTVQAQMGEMDAALSTTQPDRSRFARALDRIIRLLTATGSLATAGAALVGPLQVLTNWLGAAGEPLLRLLPALG